MNTRDVVGAVVVARPLGKTTVRPLDSLSSLFLSLSLFFSLSFSLFLSDMGAEKLDAEALFVAARAGVCTREMELWFGQRLKHQEGSSLWRSQQVE